ncbi:MAG: protein kinase [Deltaproteobacteria bacterium]|nr:protein kinase [Deltaproteobacteria bacterium]
METLPDVASRSATHSTPSGSEAAPIADRFRLRSKLGEGATGEVWRADDLHRGGAATIKLLRAELTHDPAVARRFLREARTLQHLAHPHLPVILDAGHDTVTGRYFLAQPYLEAETLRAVVERDAPMAWDDAAAILYPVMSALAAAHVAGRHSPGREAREHPRRTSRRSPAPAAHRFPGCASESRPMARSRPARAS